MTFFGHDILGVGMTCFFRCVRACVLKVMIGLVGSLEEIRRERERVRARERERERERESESQSVLV